MFRFAIIAASALTLLTSSAAVAQSKKGSNGGTVVSSQGHPIEFVRKGLEIVFYLSDDDGSPLSTKNIRGRAAIQDGGKTVTVQLSPSAPNLLVGKTETELSPQARIVFTGTVQGPHEHTLTARFTAQ
jgi:hypothetical protein